MADIVQEVLKQLNDYNEVQRQKNISERLDFYFDNWKSRLLSELANQFQPENYKNIKLFPDTSLNISRFISDKVACIYDESPIRKLVNAAGEEIESDVYNNILEHNIFDVRMDKADKLTFICNELLLIGVPRNNTVELDMITPDKFSVIQDENDPSKIKAVIYEVTYSDSVSTYLSGTNSIKNSERIFIYYDTDGKHFKFDSRWHVIPNEKNKDNVNPYKVNGKYIIPGVILHDSLNIDSIFDDTSKSSIFDSQLAIGVIGTLFNYYLKNSSHKQLIVTGGEKITIPARQVLDVMSVIQILGDGASVQLLDFQGNLQEYWNQIMNKTGFVLNQYDLALDDLTKSGTPESGYKLAIKREGLRKRIEARKKLFREYERQIFEVIRVVNNAIYSQKIDESAKLVIDFADYTTQMSQAEINENDAFEINYNISNVIAIIMKRNPDLTEEQAIQQYEKNRAINETQRGQFGKAVAAVDEAVEEFNA